MGKVIYLVSKDKKAMLDKAQAEPGAADFTLLCDTKECEAYVNSVEGKSLALTNAFEIQVHQIKDKGDAHPWPKEKRMAFLQDYLAWHDAKRNPWKEVYPLLLEDCGAYFSAQRCVDAKHKAGQHEGDVNAWAKKLEGYTGVDPGIKDAPPVDPDKHKGKDGGKDGGGIGESISKAASSITTMLALAIAAYLLYTLSQKK